MQIRQTSFAFTLLPGLLAAVPYSGIDINLPALAATGASLSRSASDVGLTMSAFMFSLAVAPLLYGPISDRLGRKPVIVFGLALFIAASLACTIARSLLELLIYRFTQGVGAASAAMTFAIIRDLFDEAVARAKIGSVIVSTNVVTIISPTARAALLSIGSWRLIYAIQAGIGTALLLAVFYGLAESVRLDPMKHPAPAAGVRSFLRVLTHRLSLAYILVGAAGGAEVFAYVTGCSLFFIGIVRSTAGQYGLILSACSVAVMSGALLDGYFGFYGVPSRQVLTIGLSLLVAASSTLLALTLTGCTPPALIAVLLMTVALAFGMTMPNILNATLRSLPDIAGAVSAVVGSTQVMAGAVSSGLVAILFDGRSTLSMAAVIFMFAFIAYWQLAYPIECRISFAETHETRSNL
ncbi:MFS transporter [Bradyrhizobium sp. USDA 4529]